MPQTPKYDHIHEKASVITFECSYILSYNKDPIYNVMNINSLKVYKFYSQYNTVMLCILYLF